MKKNILFAILIASVLLVLAACGGSSTLSGKYVLTDVQNDPQGITYADINSMYEDLGLKASDYTYMEFSYGDSFRLVMFGEEEAIGTFKLEGNTLTLTAEGGSSTATVSGKKITWTYDGGGDLIFEKK